MKTLKFKGTEVSLSFDSYQNNLQTDRLAFVDENNLPGIGAWLRKNKIASPLGYKERSGFCQYELYSFHEHA